MIRTAPYCFFTASRRKKEIPAKPKPDPQNPPRPGDALRVRVVTASLSAQELRGCRGNDVFNGGRGFFLATAYNGLNQASSTRWFEFILPR